MLTVYVCPFFVFICLFVCLSTCLFVCLSRSICLSITHSLCLSISVSENFPSVCLSVCLLVGRSVCLSVQVYLSVYSYISLFNFRRWHQVTIQPESRLKQRNTPKLWSTIILLVEKHRAVVSETISNVNIFYRVYVCMPNKQIKIAS